jgi:hypothetical protein
MSMCKKLCHPKHLTIILSTTRMLGSNSGTTSRKHGNKEPQLFFHCGSFDHPDLQSLNECIYFFDLSSEFLRIWGLLIYC